MLWSQEGNEFDHETTLAGNRYTFQLLLDEDFVLAIHP